MPNEKIYCVIPAYNESKNISRVITALKLLPYDLVVVDDGSRDDTAELAKEAGATAVKHLVNRGQGAALATGNEYSLKAGADVIVHFDADGQFAVDEIKDVIKPILDKEADIVFGSRFLGKKSNMPWTKEKIFVPLAHLVNRIAIGATLSDPQCGFRALSAEAAKKINIEQARMAHCSEIIAKAIKGGFKIKEVPVTVKYNEFGQNFGGGLRIIKDLMLGIFINDK